MIARVFGRLLLVLLSTILGLCLMELAVRVVMPAEVPGVNSSAHPIVHHRLPAHATLPDRTEEFSVTATTNGLGLRGPAPVMPRRHEVRRLLVLGDSFVFGVGVQDHETFCALLQRRFDQQRANVDVINAGTGSY